VSVPLDRSPSTGALEHHLAAAVPAPRAQVDDVVGRSRSASGLCSRQHGVALVAQAQQQVVHPLMSCGCRPMVGSSKT
jgi:hypothetical protein